MKKKIPVSFVAALAAMLLLAADHRLAARRRIGPPRRPPGLPPRREHRPRRLPGQGRRLHGLPHHARRRSRTPAGAPRKRRSAAGRAQHHVRPRHRHRRLERDDFWRALHNGKSRDGRLLYPAFPYTNYTRRHARRRRRAVRLHAQPCRRCARPTSRTNCASRTTSSSCWPAGALLYFKPAVFRAGSKRPRNGTAAPTWCEGLGHCSACHSSAQRAGRQRRRGLSGGLIPTWAGMRPRSRPTPKRAWADWEMPHIAQLLKTGVSPRATVFGPMAEVVQRKPAAPERRRRERRWRCT
jgi:hypothetical protein